MRRACGDRLLGSRIPSSVGLLDSIDPPRRPRRAGWRAGESNRTLRRAEPLPPDCRAEGPGRVYRERGERRLIPKLEDLSATGHHLLMTHASPLDLLGTIGKDRG